VGTKSISLISRISQIWKRNKTRKGGGRRGEGGNPLLYVRELALKRDGERVVDKKKQGNDSGIGSKGA